VLNSRHAPNDASLANVDQCFKVSTNAQRFSSLYGRVTGTRGFRRGQVPCGGLLGAHLPEIPTEPLNSLMFLAPK